MTNGPLRTTLFEGKFKRLLSERGWEFIERVNCCGIVVILAVTEERKVVFVEQYRIPVGSSTIEFPAGLADGANTDQNEESLESAAGRELLEETGYQAGKLTLCLSGPVSSSSSTDIMSVFLATNLRKISPGGGDHTESIVVHEVDLNSVDRWLEQKQREGLLVDPKVYAGLYFLKQQYR